MLHDTIKLLVELMLHNTCTNQTQAIVTGAKLVRADGYACTLATVRAIDFNTRV